MLKGLVVFGYENVLEYINMHNVEYILISYKYFKKMKEEGKSNDILSLIRTAERSNIKVFFVFQENENSELVDQFGVVAKVRYKIE